MIPNLADGLAVPVPEGDVDVGSELLDHLARFLAALAVLRAQLSAHVLRVAIRLELLDLGVRGDEGALQPLDLDAEALTLDRLSLHGHRIDHGLASSRFLSLLSRSRRR
jgi:hypothetical protein